MFMSNGGRVKAASACLLTDITEFFFGYALTLSVNVTVIYILTHPAMSH